MAAITAVVTCPKRIAIGEFKQETNTFVPSTTEMQQFSDFHIWNGGDVIHNLHETNCEVAGFIDVAESEGWELIPTLAAFAISGGPLSSRCETSLRRNLLDAISKALPLDGVLLSLHGAMVSESDDDPDGVTLEAVRLLIGPDVPLVVSLDLHANVTQRMVNNADAIVGFRTCPHVDQRETGKRAAKLLAGILSKQFTVSMAFVKIPMVTPASTHIHSHPGPFQRLMDAGKKAESLPGVLSASVFAVQPWLDIAEMGYSTLVVTNGDDTLARATANELALLCWKERLALCDTNLVPINEAIHRALALETGPIVLSDLADGTGAGSPGDATAVIFAMLQAVPTKSVLMCCCDLAVAALASEIGVGNAIKTTLGATKDTIYNQPVMIEGIVEFARNSAFRFGGEGYTGMEMDMGLSAILRAGNIQILITSKPVMTVDPEMYRAVGLEPMKAHVVVVKSHIQFRAGYAGIAREIILLDSPGMSSDNLVSMKYNHVPRPLFPLDDDFEWQPQAIEL